MRGGGSRRPNPNPKSNNNGGKSKEKKTGFEFCKVCRLNHDQGLRHKYFPKHKTSLSDFLSRFKTKIGEILFFLNNPTVLRPELASHNRFWCVFCDSDIDEVGSSFACENAINHLASVQHLKNSKHFLWKHGGGSTDCLDTFRVLDADLVKWEKKCELLKTAAVESSEGSSMVLHGTANDIQPKLNFENIDNVNQNALNHLQSNLSNPVMPLQYHTYEYQISYNGAYGIGNSGSNPHFVTGSSDMYSGANLRSSNDTRGLQIMTPIASITKSQTEGNVHTGAPPPWLETTDETLLDSHVKPASSKKPGKSLKLNPKRVGAAWAEKRKMELEMEKNDIDDPNWLPDFGRVWQSGSRKASRKEFEKEKQKVVKVVDEPDEIPVNVQPYVSKRMRRDAGEG